VGLLVGDTVPLPALLALRLWLPLPLPLPWGLPLLEAAALAEAEAAAEREGVLLPLGLARGEELKEREVLGEPLALEDTLAEAEAVATCRRRGRGGAAAACAGREGGSRPFEHTASRLARRRRREVGSMRG
jgi:hypothetical protein